MFIDVMTEVRLFENNQIENKVLDLVFYFFSQIILKWFDFKFDMSPKKQFLYYSTWCKTGCVRRKFFSILHPKVAKFSHK